MVRGWRWLCVGALATDTVTTLHGSLALLHQAFRKDGLGRQVDERSQGVFLHWHQLFLVLAGQGGWRETNFFSPSRTTCLGHVDQRVDELGVLLKVRRTFLVGGEWRIIALWRSTVLHSLLAPAPGFTLQHAAAAVRFPVVVPARATRCGPCPSAVCSAEHVATGSLLCLPPMRSPHLRRRQLQHQLNGRAAHMRRRLRRQQLHQVSGFAHLSVKSEICISCASAKHCTALPTVTVARCRCRAEYLGLIFRQFG